jgi:competence protein ComEA
MAPELLKTLQVVLNVNAASRQELQSIDGIGPALANRIVAFRKMRGPFRSLAALLEIRGISRGLLERIRPRVRVVNPN